MTEMAGEDPGRSLDADLDLGQNDRIARSPAAPSADDGAGTRERPQRTSPPRFKAGSAVKAWSRAKPVLWLAATVGVGGTIAFALWPQSVACPTDELLRRAERAIERGDRRAACESLDSLLACAPDHGLALLYRGQLARDLGDSSLAMDYIRRVDSDPPHEGGVAHFLEGTILLERNLARKAERAFLKAIELHPTYPQPRERLVRLYSAQLRTEECRRQLDGLRRLRPWTLTELVVWHICTGFVNSPQKTIPELKGYAEADPRDVHSRLALARYEMYVDRTEQAVGLLRGLLPAVDEEFREEVRGLLAESLVLEVKFEEARKVLGDALPPQEAHRRLWRAHGLYAAAVEDWDRAVVCLRRALRNHPDDITALYRLGLALERSGRHAEAKRVLERTRLTEELYTLAARLLGGDPNRTDLMFGMVMDIGRLFVRLDRAAEALPWLEQARRWKPGDRDAASLLARAVRDVRSVEPNEQAAPAASERFRQNGVSTATARALAATPLPDSPESAFGPPDEAPAPVNRRIQLVDRHASAGIEFQYFNGHSEQKYLLDSTGGGVAVLDYDGDGWPDLYFTQGCTIPYDPARRTHIDRLYRNRGDGSFQDVTERAGLGSNQYGQGCAAGDYDNDGDPDLFVANYGTNIVYCNNGDGTFSDVTARTGIDGEHWSASLALADLDRDGRLDLYVTTYVLEPLKVCRDATGRPLTCSPGNYDAEPDILYRNRGDGTFEDVSASAGILAPDGKGLGVVVADFNDDGWSDIYVANDGTPNFLFRNMGTDAPQAGLRFEEIGLWSGVALSEYGSPQAGMGIASADLNADGRLDLYVTNFLDDVNTLYLNQGEFIFSDATRRAQLAAPTRPFLGFGTQALDLDLDGHPELFVANGHIDDFRSRGEPWKMRPQLFSNRADGTFAEISSTAGDYFHGESLGRGVARLDWNRDGRPELVVVHQDRPVALLENRAAACGHRRIVLELRGVESNRDAIGARIRIRAGGRTQTLEICGGDGFFASNDRRQCAGVGTATRIDRLEIDWPSGRRSRWTDLPTDCRLLCVEGRLPRIEPLDGAAALVQGNISKSSPNRLAGKGRGADNRR